MDQTASQIASLDGRLQETVRQLVAYCRASGWPVEIRAGGARRSQAYQNALYARGRTAPGPIVTYTRASRHVDGLAFDLDLAGYPRDAALPLLRVLGEWWKSGGLRWGGDWGDYGHFEL